jgi:hypothetical protein
MIVLLDAGPLGLASNPRPSPENQRCNVWLEGLLAEGHSVGIPEIADYEVRREILRIGRMRGIYRLDRLKATLMYAPISTNVMLQAARFWAEARRQGHPTAPDREFMILAAQAVILENETELPVVVATTNPDHLDRFVDARHWIQIA